MSLDRTIIPQKYAIETPKYWQIDRRVLKQNTNLHLLAKNDELLSSLVLAFKGGLSSSVDGLDLGLMKNMILSGTKNYPKSKISEELDFYGAYFQLNPNYDQIEIQVICLHRYIKPVISLLKEVLTNCLFTQEDFEIYLENKKQQFQISKKKVAFLGRTHFMNQVFGDEHTYGILRHDDDYKKGSCEAVINYYNTFIKNQAFELFLTGKFEEEDIRLIETELIPEQIDLSEKRRLNTRIIPKGTQFNIELEDAMQSSVTIGFSCPNSQHPEFLEWKVVNTILGGYFGSRLMKNIREEKGYTYGIGSRLVHYPESGMFKISTEVGSQHVEDTLKQIYLEIERMKTELISESELDLVKNYLLGGVLSSSDGLMQQSAMYKNLYDQGFDWQRMHDFIDVINTITPERVLECSQSFFNNHKLVEVVAGVKWG